MKENIVQLSQMMNITNHGHILYIYESIEDYIENASSYIFTGIEQGHHILFIENKEIFDRISLKLQKILSLDQMKSVHFFDNYDFYRLYGDFQYDLIVQHFSKIIHQFKDKSLTVRTWANVDWKEQDHLISKLTTFEKLADHSVQTSNLISVCAYNGHKISAALQNSMLKSHEYFMTDKELVKSSLYNKRSVIFPSIYEQKEHSKLKGQLQATKHQLRSFIKENSDPIVIYDLHDRVVSINDAFVSTFGFTSNEVIGLNVTDLPIIPIERIFEANLSKSYAILGEKIKGYETIRKTKDGRTLFIILSSFPLLNEDSTPNGWAVIYKDITDKKEAQELLIKSEKLPIAGELAAGIAHEIRNPITTIKGFLQLLQASGYEKQTYYDIMKSEIDRIELILSELLMLAKPQAVHFAPKDIKTLVKDMITLLNPQAIMNNVQIRTDFVHEEVSVMCEENQLKLVFINFIKNALEAMPNGGNLIIKLITTDKELLIRFIDEGCGIPKHLLSKLGQPFYTTKEKGTGLGFMVSKRIIENHQGTVEITSEVNKGTVIDVKLPL